MSTDKGLTFKLGLSTIAARKEVKDFVRFAEREGKRVNLGAGSGGAKASVAAPIKEAQRAAGDLRKMLVAAQREVDRISVRGGASLTGAVKRVEHQLKAAYGRLSAGDLSDRDFRRIVNRKIQFLRTVAQEQIRHDADIRKSAEQAAAEQRKLAERAVTDEKRKNDQLERLRKDSLARLQHIDISAGAVNLQERKRAQEQLRQALQAGHVGEVADARRAVGLVLAEYRKMASLNVSGNRVGSASSLAEQNAFARQMSKNTMLVFGFQQVMEDASYGAKYALNNLATMAVGMGGPGGIVALLGIMALQLPDVIARFRGATDAAGDFNEMLVDQVGIMRRLEQARLSRADDRRRSPLSSLGDDSLSGLVADGKKVEALRRDRDELRGLLNDLASLGDLERELKAKQNILRQEKGNYIVGGGPLQSEAAATAHERTLRELEAEIRELEGEKRSLSERVAAERPELGVSGPGVIVGRKGIADEIAKEAREADTAFREQAEALSEAERGFWKLADARDAYADFKGDFKAEAADLSKEASSVDNVRKQFQELTRDRMAEHDAAVEAVKAQAEQNYALAAAREDYDSMAQALRGAVDEMGRLTTETNAAIEEKRKLADAYGRAGHEADELLETSERLTANAERHLEKIKDQIAELKKASQASRYSFDASVFGVQQNVVDKQASKRAESLKARDKAMLTARFGPKAKGLNELISQRAEAIDAQVEREKATTQHRMLMERGRVLSGRAEFQEQAAKTDPTQYAAARDTLEESQGLLMQAAGSAEDPATAIGYMREAERIQKEIERLYAAEADSKKREAESTEAALDTLRKQMDDLSAKKARIESIKLWRDGTIEETLRIGSQLDQIAGKLRDIGALNGGILGEGVKLPGADGAPGLPQAGISMPQGIAVPSAIQQGMAAAGNTTNVSNSRSTATNVVSNTTLNVGKVVAGGRHAGQFLGELAQASKSRNIRVA